MAGIQPATEVAASVPIVRTEHFTRDLKIGKQPRDLPAPKKKDDQEFLRKYMGTLEEDRLEEDRMGTGLNFSDSNSREVEEF